jgi:hypothetical protein
LGYLRQPHRSRGTFALILIHHKGARPWVALDLFAVGHQEQGKDGIDDQKDDHSQSRARKSGSPARFCATPMVNG